MSNQKPSAPLIIESTLALIEQFSTSLSSSNESSSITAVDSPPPLPLLSTAASALKAQVTKLSLLTITPPFTPSAVSTSLAPLNESILPSLTTASLLITPTNFTASFAGEAAHLCHTVFKDLSTLVKLVQERDRDGKPAHQLTEQRKTAVTEATGKVWEDCDDLVKFANAGLSGYLVKKASQWLELMKDAVKELQDYDPEEDEDDGGLFDDGLEEVSEEVSEAKDESSTSDASGTIKAGVKSEALKVITRVPQSIHVVIKQRLGKLPPPSELSASQRTTIDMILRTSRQISECIDECAENMYMGDLEGCLKKAGQARQMTIEVAESVTEPWKKAEGVGHDKGGQAMETKEDLYIKRALAWVRQVETGSVTVRDSPGPKQERTPIC